MLVTLLIGILLILLLWYVLGMVGMGDPIRTIVILVAIILLVAYAFGVVHA